MGRLACLASASQEESRRREPSRVCRCVCSSGLATVTSKAGDGISNESQGREASSQAVSVSCGGRASSRMSSHVTRNIPLRGFRICICLRLLLKSFSECDDHAAEDDGDDDDDVEEQPFRLALQEATRAPVSAARDATSDVGIHFAPSSPPSLLLPRVSLRRPSSSSSLSCLCLSPSLAGPDSLWLFPSRSTSRGQIARVRVRETLLLLADYKSAITVSATLTQETR